MLSTQFIAVEKNQASGLIQFRSVGFLCYRFYSNPLEDSSLGQALSMQHLG